MTRTALLGFAMALAWLIAPAHGTTLNRADQHRPVARIAADLAMTRAEFVACFWNVTPASDHTPSGTTQRANKAILLPCLQKANPDITHDTLDTVMDRYRPEGANGGHNG